MDMGGTVTMSKRLYRYIECTVFSGYLKLNSKPKSYTLVILLLKLNVN